MIKKIYGSSEEQSTRITQSPASQRKEIHVCFILMDDSSYENYQQSGDSRLRYIPFNGCAYVSARNIMLYQAIQISLGKNM